LGLSSNFSVRNNETLSAQIHFNFTDTTKTAALFDFALWCASRTAAFDESGTLVTLQSGELALELESVPLVEAVTASWLSPHTTARRVEAFQQPTGRSLDGVKSIAISLWGLKIAANGSVVLPLTAKVEVPFAAARNAPVFIAPSKQAAVGAVVMIVIAVVGLVVMAMVLLRRLRTREREIRE
jgi:hypothetical protein